MYESFTVSGFTTILQQLLPEPHAGLLIGLLFGTKSTLSHEFTEVLIRSGVIHIIALSGMNVTILANGIAVFASITCGKRGALFLTLFSICWFVWFVGGSPTIVRAAIMAVLSLLATLFGRQYWAFGSLALTAIGMLIYDSSYYANISYQLSVLSTLGIILFSSKAIPAQNVQPEEKIQTFWQKGIRSLWEWIRGELQITLAAQSLTLPLILWLFHRVSLIAPLTNLAIGWIIFPVTVLGWITAFAGWVWLPLGKLPAMASWLLLEILRQIVMVFSSVSWASI